MTIIKQHLPPSKWTRPTTTRGETRAIVMHWTGKAQQGPVGVMNYWAQRAGTYGSAHYVIGNDGVVYEAIPAKEVAYHCGSKQYTEMADLLIRDGTRISANQFTVGVEMCILNTEGEYSDECMGSAVELVADLCRAYGIGTTRVVTHNMVVGWKECPKWWVKNPADFELFRHYVAVKMGIKD